MIDAHNSGSSGGYEEGRTPLAGEVCDSPIARAQSSGNSPRTGEGSNQTLRESDDARPALEARKGGSSGGNDEGGGISSGIGEDADAARETDPDSLPPRKSQVRQEPRQGGGNLFLTCLRLRFEEAGSWEKALEERQPQQQDAEQPASPEVNADDEEVYTDTGVATDECNDGGDGVTDVSARRKTWKELAGREHGEDAYRVGDLGRTAARASVRKLTKFAQKVRRNMSEAAGVTSWGVPTISLSGANGPTFGFSGANAEIVSSEDGHDAVIAVRSPDADDGGIAITSAPLASFSQPPQGQNEAVVNQYYFELQVLEVAPTATSTMHVGFVWHPHSHIDDPALAAETLPASASEHPHALVAGGDLPRWYLGGSDLGGKVAGWRPLIHIVEGSVIGAFLEVRYAAANPSPQPDTPETSGVLNVDKESGEKASTPTLLFRVYQDGVRRAELTLELNRPEDEHALLPGPGPHGLVDVQGSVQKVQLRPATTPPDFPTQ